MNENELMAKVFDAAGQYLAKEKVFVQNPDRIREIDAAVAIAKELFARCTVTINDDPMQLGTMYVHIEGFDMVVRGKREIEMFCDMIAKADNFELYPKNGNVVFSAAFQNALILL